MIAFGVGLAALTVARAQGDAPLKFNCVIRDAQILPDRTQMRCANTGLNGLNEFAAETNQPYANRVAAAIIQALRSGTPLMLTYAPSPELNPDGCSPRTCRKIIDVGGNGRIALPPRVAPAPLDGPEPQIEPTDFDPVDPMEEEPGPPDVVAAPPQPALPLLPSPQTRPMQPILD